MAREAELYDGTVLEFPDNTPDEVIQRVAKEQTFLRGTSDLIQKPEPEGESWTGLAGRLGVQAAPTAVAGLGALAWDGTVGTLQNMGTQLANVKRRYMGEEELPYRDPFASVNALSGLGKKAADAVGLPEPFTPEGRTFVSAGQAAVEALGGAGLAKMAGKGMVGGVKTVLDDLAAAPKTQAAIGGLAGGGAQVAAESDVNPLIGMGAGMAAGLGGVAAAQGVRSGVQGARRLADSALLRTDDAREAAAAQRVRSAASDPDAALRELDEGAGAELVPGSRPTTFQATGDLGLGGLERRLQTENPGVFAQRRGEQNTARVDALRGVGGGGEAEQVVSFLKGQLDEIDRVTLGYEDRARSAAREAAERIAPSDDAEGLGRAVRGSMKDAEDAARLRERELWTAIDPDGTLEAASQSTREAAHGIYGKLSRSAQLGLSGEERAIADRISEFGPMVPFREMVDLSSHVKEAMRSELRNKGRTKTYGRLAELSSAVRDGMQKSATVRIMEDPGVKARIGQWFDDYGAGTRQGPGRADERAQMLATDARPVPGMGGEESSWPRGSGGPAGNSGVQGPAERKGKPLSLGEFIARNGGLELTPDARHYGFDNLKISGRRIARPGGLSIDSDWRHILREQGYLPKDADGYHTSDVTRAIFDALELETKHGRKVYRPQDEAWAEQLGRRVNAADGPEAEFRAAEKRIVGELRAAGVSPDDTSSSALYDAAERLARGDETDAITAYERAVMDMEDAGPVRASYTPNEKASAGSALDGFRDDPDAARRYRAATEQTRKRVGTFGKGYAGQILRNGDDRQSFRMADASVAANVFRPGPTGGARVKAAVNAGASLGDVSEIAALSLSKHVKDGVLDPKGFQRWRSLHADALKELPEEARARFASASLASQALDRVAAARKSKMDDLNKSVLGKLAKIDTRDLPNEIAGIVNARDGAARMARLVAATRSNKEARDGLRRALAEHVERKFISTEEVATSGADEISAKALATFMRDKGAVFRQVFSGDDLLRMQAVVDDIRRAKRTTSGLRIPGSPGTAADLQPGLDRLAKQSGEESLLTQLWKGGGFGWLVGDFGGAAAGAGGVLGKRLVGSIRAAGLRKVDDLVLEMMLNPSLARAALMKAPKKPDTGSQQVLAHLLARRSPLALAAASDEGRE